MCEMRNPRHHPLAYSLFLAGGGINGGTVIGKTSSTCKATLLHRLGPEHTRLTFRRTGRDFPRMTAILRHARSCARWKKGDPPSPLFRYKATFCPLTKCGPRR